MAYYQNVPTSAQMLQLVRERRAEAREWLAHKAALIEAERTIEHAKQRQHVAEERRRMETKRRATAHLLVPDADPVSMRLNRGNWQRPTTWTVTGRGAAATFTDHKEAEREARMRASGRP